MPEPTRTPPRERFLPAVEPIDLAAAFEALLAEPVPARHGHRQKTLVHQGPFTLAIYHFEPGGSLPEHVVDGSVVIHCLAGGLRVTVDAVEHRLGAGSLLRLARGMYHDVRSDVDSRMLLTVCLEGPGSHA